MFLSKLAIRYLLKRLSSNVGHKNGQGHGSEQIHIIIFKRVASHSYQLPYWHELKHNYKAADE